MKVLIGMTRSDTALSGSFRHICQLGERLQVAGVEVVYVLGGAGVAQTRLEAQGQRVIRLPTLERELRPLRDLRVLGQLLGVVWRERPDLCSWHTAKIGALGRIVSLLLGRRSYYIPHGVPFAATPENCHHRSYARLERWLAWLPTNIIGVCEYDRKQFLRIGVSPRRLKVIHNGMPPRVAVDRVPEARASGAPLQLITAARFEAQKDYDTLAQACSLLNARGCRLRLDIYGEGPDETRVRLLFAGLTSVEVRFRAVVDDFAARLEQADAFVLSSHWEGLPRSIIEAMSCGRPVVATDVGGCDELVRHGDSGWLVAHRDAGALAAALQQYLDHPDLLQQHGRAALARFQRSYTLDSMLDKYLREYLGSESPGVLLDDNP